MPESNLIKALIKFHQQVGKIHKDARAQYGAYADLAGVLSTVTPVLSANGLTLVQTFLEDSLVTELYHESGEKISSTMKLVVPQGRNELHCTGAAITYLRRYMICSILSIVADMDTDGVVIEEPEEKPKAKSKDQPKASEPVTITDQPLSKDDYNLAIELLKDVHRKDPAKLESITEAFRKQYSDSASIPLSQAITTQGHVQFINDLL
jgi:hypothetical protein